MKISENRAVAIKDFGFISAIGHGWEINAASMHAGYDGFRKISRFKGAWVDFDETIRSYLRAAELIRFALEDLPEIPAQVPVIFCFPEAERPGIMTDELQWRKLRTELEQLESFPNHLLTEVYTIHKGRVSIAHALEKAASLIHEEKKDSVLIISWDSYRNVQTNNIWNTEPYGYSKKDPYFKRRFVGKEYKDGFVGGEAASAMLVGAPDNTNKELLCVGTGHGAEKSTVITKPSSTGTGLTTAVKASLEESGIKLHECRYILSSLSGEEYFAKEASIVQSRALEEKVSSQPVWHPAMYIGEVGAVIGSGMIMMAFHANREGYAQGTNTVGFLSNDQEARASFVLSYR